MRSYATTNFLGKGETLSLNIETGSRSNNYQASLTEPYVFDRPDLARREPLFAKNATTFWSRPRSGVQRSARRRQPDLRSSGARSFSRLFTSYTYEIVHTASSDALRTARDRLRRPRTAPRRSTTTVTVTTASGTTTYTPTDPRHQRSTSLTDRRTPHREPCRTDVRVRHRGQPVHAETRHAHHG